MRFSVGTAGQLRIALGCRICFDWPEPANIRPVRRTTELTVALLQLVASGRDMAALPLWAIENYIERGYVVGRPIQESGLTGRLYGASTPMFGELPYVADFICLVRENCYLSLPGITLL